MSSSAVPSVDGYTVGWICALAVELAAARKFLDAEHPSIHRQRDFDDNSYILGNIAQHNVVLSVLPQGRYGKVSAATVGNQMRATFRNIKLWLMVGIGGGVPSLHDINDVRLGDVVVSTPSGTHGGVIQYDLGKTLPDGKFVHTGSLNSPHPKFLTATGLMKATQIGSKEAPAFDELVRKVIADPMAGDFHRCYPGPEDDRLYHTDYKHENMGSECTTCDSSRLHVRKERPSTIPRVHYGLIASGDKVVKDAITRDKLAEQFGMKCFEMEAAGVINSLSCLVVRGICDYCDSHKLKGWQSYAALVAAAYTKTLLQTIAVDEQQSTANALAVVNFQTRKLLLSRWISGCEDVDTAGDIESNARLRHGDTCSWLFHDKRFQHWCNDLNSKSTMWYNAPIGSGKTVLSAAVVDYLKKQGHKVVYFCYSFKNSSRRNFLVGLRSLAAQLVMLPQDDFPEEIEAMQATQMTEKNSMQMPDPLVRPIFQQALRPFNQVYLVIDGLDECSNEKAMVQEVTSLISEKRLGAVKWFITSRDEKRIRDMFTKQEVLEVSPTSETLWWDINQYLSSGLQEAEDVQTPVDREEDEETDKISLWTTRCDGNFLYSKFVLETLQEHHSVASRKKLFAEFPNDLQGWYLRTLVKLCDESSETRELLRRTFVYLTHAEKSMTWIELQHALAIDRERREYDGDYVIKKARIQQLCGAFLHSDNHSPTEAEPTTSVRLSHKTVLDFLLQDPSKLDFDDAVLGLDSSKRDLLRSFFPNAADAAKEIGLDCIWYLSYKRYRNVDQAMALVQLDKEEDAFLKYASAFWFRILTKVRRGEEPSSEVCRFLESPNFWTCTSIQSFIAPYLFTRFRKGSGTGFYMDLPLPGSTDESPFGHPMPQWLAITKCGQQLDWDFCHFLTDWYEVLASHPGQLSHCVPLQKMSSGMGRHLNSYPDVKACLPCDNIDFEQGGRIFPSYFPILRDNSLHVEMLGQEGSPETEENPTYYCRSQSFGKGEVVKESIKGNEIISKDIISFSYRESDSTCEIWYLTTTPLRVERLVDGHRQKFEAPSAWRDSESITPWSVTRIHHLPPHTSSLTIVYLSKRRRTRRRAYKRDRQIDDWSLAEDSGSDSGSYKGGRNDGTDDDDDNDDDDDYGTEMDDTVGESDDYDDSTEDDDDNETSDSDCSTILRSETEGVLLIRQYAPPLWILLGDKDTDVNCMKFSFRPRTNDVVWTSVDAESSLSSVEGSGDWQVREFSDFPKPSTAVLTVHRDLHFSTCGDYLYFLDMTLSTQTDPICQVSLRTYRYPTKVANDSPIEQVGAPQQITYRLTRRLNEHAFTTVYTHWGDDQVVMILPPLTCKPKIVKFTLPKGQVAPPVEILNSPVYLPATMGLSSTLMYQPGQPGKKHQLYLYFFRKSQGDYWSPRRPVDELRPIVIRWYIPRKEGSGWRAWDQEKDSRLVGWDQQGDLYRMLRGKYIDEGSRFSVPIRSGLDWTRKSYLSCY